VAATPTTAVDSGTQAYSNVDTAGKFFLNRITRGLRMALGLGALALFSACGGGGGEASVAAPVQLGAALPDAGDFIAIEQKSLSLSESSRTGTVQVSRLGAAEGMSSVNYRFIAGSADASADFRGSDGTLSWSEGDTGSKTISFIVESDIVAENTEDFRIEISGVNGQESLGINDSVTITLEDAPCSAVFPASVGSNTVLSAPCYRLQQNATVAGSAQLKVAAGTTIIADDAMSISLKGQSTLSMEGEEKLPVFVKSASGLAGSWDGIRLQSSSALHRVKHTELKGAVNAFDLSSGGFALFNNNALIDNTGAGVKLPLADAETLGIENRFTATTRGIELFGNGIDAGQTVRLPAQSTHYVLSNGLINKGTLELAAGTNLRMAADVNVLVLNTGVINAIGTAEMPITIEGLQASAGYWDGIQYVSSNSANNRYEHVRISHGGGDPARNGNIIVDGLGTRITLQHCVLTHSAGFGLVYDSGDFQVDMTEVTFEQNRLGDQSL